MILFSLIQINLLAKEGGDADTYVFTFFALVRDSFLIFLAMALSVVLSMGQGKEHSL